MWKLLENQRNPVNALLNAGTVTLLNYITLVSTNSMAADYLYMKNNLIIEGLLKFA